MPRVIAHLFFFLARLLSLTALWQVNIQQLHLSPTWKFSDRESICYWICLPREFSLNESGLYALQKTGKLHLLFSVGFPHCLLAGKGKAGDLFQNQVSIQEPTCSGAWCGRWHLSISGHYVQWIRALPLLLPWLLPVIFPLTGQNMGAGRGEMLISWVEYFLHVFTSITSVEAERLGKDPGMLERGGVALGRDDNIAQPSLAKRVVHYASRPQLFHSCLGLGWSLAQMYSIKEKGTIAKDLCKSKHSHFCLLVEFFRPFFLSQSVDIVQAQSLPFQVRGCQVAAAWTVIHLEEMSCISRSS